MFVDQIYYSFHVPIIRRDVTKLQEEISCSYEERYVLV